jgi:hypothetical protein
VNNKHFTYSEKAKLATVEPQSEANPPQVTAEEKADGSEISLRSFAPRDVAEMARIFAPAGGVSSVFGRTAAVAASMIRNPVPRLNSAGHASVDMRHKSHG